MQFLLTAGVCVSTKIILERHLYLFLVFLDFDKSKKPEVACSLLGKLNQDNEYMLREEIDDYAQCASKVSCKR